MRKSRGDAVSLEMRFVTPPHPCSYLPEQEAMLEYQYFPAWTAAGYEEYVSNGWRRFGHAAFHPVCAACRHCQPIRVVVDQFQPNRNQRRVRRRNDGVVRLEVARPRVTRAKVDLHHRFHAFQAAFKGWPAPGSNDTEEYRAAFVQNPFPTEEWQYYLDDELVGIGYVDALPDSLSAIYFFYAPEQRPRALGTWNVLCVLDAARARSLPHVYLGYYVAGCRSMAYKATFGPAEVRDPSGPWRPFEP